MTLKNFLEDEYFSLPKNQSDKQDFKLFIFKQFEIFIQKLEELKVNDTFLDYKDFTIDIIYERQVKLVDRIKQAIEYAYDGKPSKAYKSLDQGLINNLKDFTEVLNIRDIQANESFYRMRIHKENYPLSSENFFHIPFNLRGQVKTQRFSIPGFPSLYLGNSIYVCWEELKRPNINDFQVARLKSNTSIRIIDLSPPDNMATLKQLYRYLMTWPLVLSSSVKVREYNDTFKPEYIIPQLLLQWVREKHDVDGIAYQTTNIDYSTTLSKGNFTNFVLPVKENKIRGLCDILKSKFEISEAMSIQLKQLSSGSGNFIYNDHDINRNIQCIEFIKGQKSMYGNSILGGLERTLNSMPTEKIKVKSQNENI